MRSGKKTPSCAHREEGKRISEDFKRFDTRPILKKGHPFRQRDSDSPISGVTSYKMDIYV
jgi:hypothetical protein